MLRQGTIRILMKAGFSSDLTPSLDIMGGGGSTQKDIKLRPWLKGSAVVSNAACIDRREVDEMEGRSATGGSVTQRSA